jgi:hypothetical protein
MNKNSLLENDDILFNDTTLLKISQRKNSGLDIPAAVANNEISYSHSAVVITP